MPVVLQLCCALEEWQSGTYSALKFEVAGYRILYKTIVDNLQVVLDTDIHCLKFEAHWARICGRA